MNRFHRWLALPFFILPVNIYGIGGGLGAGVQFPLFRIQQTVFGYSTITIVQDVLYVINGVIGGRTAVSILLWTAALALYAAGSAMLCRGYPIRDRIPAWCSPGRIMMAGTMLLLGSTVMQYGPTFVSAGGYAIPVGMPLFFYLGWLMSPCRIHDEHPEDFTP